MTVQPAIRNRPSIDVLQDYLNAYLSQRLEFADLRTKWTAVLADHTSIRSDAIRLLYNQPSNNILTAERKLTLKHIAEAALHGDHDDSTDVLIDDSDTGPSALDIVDNVALVDEVDAVSGKVVTTPSNVNISKPAHRGKGLQERLATINTNNALVPGRVLSDRFVLEAPLGLGGMGVVYRANDRLRQDTVGGSAQVALKILREEHVARPELIDALQREALQTQCLSHPNIVRVYDFHRDGETCFLTMELLEGELLKTVMSQTQPALIATERVMQIIVGMCNGIAHARANGLVHGDFKPSNVFLTAGDEPKILDFGLANVAASGSQTAATVDSGSAPIKAMTPAYASCNRLEYGAPSYSDDVYSLCCVIYELLAGHHPYDRKSALEARELNLKPRCIENLTEFQWQTLAAGLEFSAEDRTTEVFHLQTVFTDRPPQETSALSVETNPFFQEGDVRGVRQEKKRRAGPAVIAITGFLLSASLAAGIAIIGNLDVPSPDIDVPREPALENRTNELTVQKNPSLLGTTASSNVASVGTGDAGTPLPTGEVIESSMDAEAPSIPIAALGMTGRSDVAAVDTVEAGAPLPTGEVIESGMDAEAPNIPIAATSRFQLDSGAYFVREDVTAVAMRIARQGNLSSEASVEWSTYAGSAEPGTDYVNVFRRLIYFAAGEKTKTVFVSIVSDNESENNEDLQVVLTAPGGDLMRNRLSARSITIIDDDS